MGWTLKWDGSRSPNSNYIVWFLDNIIVLEADPPTGGPAPKRDPKDKGPVSPMPGIGGVGDGNMSIFEPFEIKTAEDARRAWELIQMEMMLVGIWVTYLGMRHAYEVADLQELLDLMDRLAKRWHQYERYLESVAKDLPSGSGECVDALNDAIDKIPGSDIGFVTDPMLKSHYWLELPDGRILDPTLRANLEAYGIPTLPPAGQSIFSAAEHASFMRNWPRIIR